MRTLLNAIARFLIPASLACAGTGAGVEPAAPIQRLREHHEQLRARWASQVEQLGSRCESQGQTEGVEAIRQLLHPAASDAMVIPILSPSGMAGTASSDKGRADWQLALTRLRRQYAKDLFELATLAFRAGDVSYCYDVIREVIEHDPDHGPARALMGFTKYREQWVTSFAAGKLKSGHVWDAKFGWVPKTQLSRLEKGEQVWKGQWLPRDEVANYRQHWSNGWETETDHYIVRTNVSLERGVEFGTKLEKLYAIFFRLFAGFFSPRDQLAVLFDPPNRRTALGKIESAERRAQKKFRVHFYRTRDEYLEVLRPHVKSGLEISTGMYLPGTRTAYFYVHPEMDDTTVIHEATHQLFGETRDHRHGDGTRGNFWVLEGVACYMESFRDRGDYVELGSWDSERLARGRRRRDQFMPIGKFIELEMKDFDGAEVYDLYLQAACFCHFLMHHDRGRYRDAFVKYLEEVYLGRADYSTLSALLEIDYATLDRRFQEHVAAGKLR